MLKVDFFKVGVFVRNLGNVGYSRKIVTFPANYCYFGIKLGDNLKTIWVTILQSYKNMFVKYTFLFFLNYSGHLPQHKMVTKQYFLSVELSHNYPSSFPITCEIVKHVMVTINHFIYNYNKCCLEKTPV